jgi:Zn-dependent metalloprotease
VSAANIDSAKKEIALASNARHRPGWKISRHKGMITPITVFGNTTEPIHGLPAKAARAFMAQNRQLFKMHKGLKDLKLIHVSKSDNSMRDVRFQQLYQGLPVFGAGYSVHIRPDGRIDMANGHYYHNIHVSTSSKIPSSIAKQKVLNDLGKEDGHNEHVKGTLGVYRIPNDDNFVLAWRITAAAHGPDSQKWQYFVNARSGRMITRVNLNPPYIGKGNIIKNSADSASKPVKITLHRLDKSGYLRGLYADVHNMIHKRAYSPAHNFSYREINPHFDEVNVYYYLDEYRENFENHLGNFSKEKWANNYALIAYVHDQNNPNNAHLILPDTIIIGENMSRKAAVIEHEATHALVHKLDPNSLYSNHKEEGAINEGLADFFAAAYENDPDLPGQGRNVAHPYYTNYSNLPRDNGHIHIPDSHEGGNFFASILWGIRVNKYGFGNMPHHELYMDIYDAIKKLSASPTFIEFRDAMMSADDENYKGKHTNLIQNSFAKMGVGRFTPLNVNIEGTSKLNSDETGTWTADISNGSGPYHYTWYRRKQSFDGLSSYYKAGTGRSYTGSASDTTDFNLRLHVTGPDKTGRTIFYVDAGGMDHPFPNLCNDDNEYVCIGND